MKGLPALLCALLGLLILPACETDLPPEPSQAPAALRRGITGQGTLYQQDQSNDPIIREESRIGQ